MPKKPNFNFERQQRDKAKAEKKAAKAEAKVVKKGDDRPPEGAPLATE